MKSTKTSHTKINEEAPGSYAIPADSFNTPNSYDMNVQPSPIATNAGGIPNQWTGSQPISRWDLMTNPIVMTREDGEEVNEPLRHVKSFDEFLTDSLNK